MRLSAIVLLLVLAARLDERRRRTVTVRPVLKVRVKFFGHHRSGDPGRRVESAVAGG